MASGYEERIARYLAAHPGATRDEARGHGRTGEHGVTKIALGNGEVGVSFRDDQYTDRAMRAIEKAGAEDNTRVSVALVNKAGDTLNLWVGKGFQFGSLRALAAGGAGFSGAVQ